MPQALSREPFSTRLKCARCGADGRAVWDENTGPPEAGPMAALISLSDNFFQRMPKNHLGQLEIACVACGQAQPD